MSAQAGTVTGSHRGVAVRPAAAAEAAAATAVAAAAAASTKVEKATRRDMMSALPLYEPSLCGYVRAAGRCRRPLASSIIGARPIDEVMWRIGKGQKWRFLLRPCVYRRLASAWRQRQQRRR